MQSLRSKKLLVLAPHMKAFIKDQTTLVRSYFSSVTVLIPIPRFSEMVLSLPYAKSRFDFIRQAVESSSTSGDCDTLFAKFFTLPIEIMRRRNCFLAARSCVKNLTLSALEFDLIHAHFLELGYSGAAFKDKCDKPLIVTAHGSDVYDLPFRDSWYQAIAKYVLSKADQVITVSEFNATKLLSIGISSSKLHVIYNGYDEQIFRPMSLQEARKRLSLPLKKKILLSVGNLVNAKGHMYSINAMSVVLKKRDDVVLVIVGSGPLKAKLVETIKRLGLNGKVLLIGRKPHKEIPIWINASDIFVLPSLNEGFPTVIPEAMACGKPIIGTKVGGVPEALSHQDLGILVNPGDPEVLASSILEALKKKWKPETITHHAKQYSWSNLVKQILGIYQQVLLDAQ